MTDNSKPTILPTRQAIALPASYYSGVDSRFQRLFTLDDSALRNGMRIVGGPGAGKSRLMGRAIARQALLRGQPQVIIDPTGGIVSNLIDSIASFPQEIRRLLWKQLVYVDVAATDYVVPTPLYYQADPSETLFAVANRFPAVLKRLDPQLQSAPIMGWNPLFECAIFSGQIAVVLGQQVDFVADLIRSPQQYKAQLRHALEIAPELERPVAYFRKFMDPTSGNLRDRHTSSFLNKLLPILSDPTMLAVFAARKPGIDWDDVVRQRQTVIIDFQNELDPERRQFKMVWWFRSFIDFAKRRGVAGRNQVVYFYLDEITQLLGIHSGEGNSVLGEDLEELVAVLARNYGIVVIVAHQNLTQVDERVRNILMQCGTQVVGNLSNPDDALYLARQFYTYQPFWVKKKEPVWMGVQDVWGVSKPSVIDYRDQEFTPDEQLLMAAEQFRLPRFQFLVRAASSEGNISQHLQRISIENLEAGRYPDYTQVSEVLGYLRQKWGIPMQTLLEEIRSRKPSDIGHQPLQVKSADEPAILEEKFPHPHDTADHLPEPPDTDQPLPLPTEGDSPAPGGDDDDFWC